MALYIFHLFLEENIFSCWRCSIFLSILVLSYLKNSIFLLKSSGFFKKNKGRNYPLYFKSKLKSKSLLWLNNNENWHIGWSLGNRYTNQNNTVFTFYKDFSTTITYMTLPKIANIKGLLNDKRVLVREGDDCWSSRNIDWHNL